MSDTRTEPYLRADRAPVDEPLSPAGSREEVEAAPRVSRRQRRRTRLRALLLALLAGLALAALVSIVWQPDGRVAREPERATAPPPAPASGAARYPVATDPVALPPLDASDATILSALAVVFGDATLASYVQPDRVVRRIVATVDNVPRATAPPALWPAKPASGMLSVTTSGGRITLAANNSLRYAAYVRVLESLDRDRFVAFYRRNYPLFQQAYRELGYPDGHFNDRAVEAIDVLIATPSIPEPLLLVQPKVFLQYADRDVEALPAGQKVMLRIGAPNAQRVKAKLYEIRSAITDPTAAAAR